MGINSNFNSANDLMIWLETDIEIVVGDEDGDDVVHGFAAQDITADSERMN